MRAGPPPELLYGLPAGCSGAQLGDQFVGGALVGYPSHMQPQSVRLFIKPWCPWCELATRWLDARGIKYTVLDVTSDPAAYAEMRHLSGQSRAPTLQVNGRVLADFGPDELARFWATVEKEQATA